MRKLIFILFIVLIITVNISGSKVATFEDINNPSAIIIIKNRLFISEKTTLFIYSLDQFKLINKFGKEGEGPMEFKSNHQGEGIRFTIDLNRIFINSETKLSLFDLKGKFIKESRVVPNMNFISAGKNYISRSLSKSDGNYPKITVSLFDSEFKKKKDLFITNVDSGMGAKIPTPMYNYNYTFYKDKIYISTGSGGIRIDVYDTNGGKEFSIIKNLGRKLLSKDYISRVKEHYKTSPRTKNFWEYFKKNLSFQSHFPGIRSFNISKNRIYIQTYQTKGNKTEWIVFNLKGSELGKAWFPSIEVNPITNAPYTIFGNSLYWFFENDEEESWDLFRYEIPKF